MKKTILKFSMVIIGLLFFAGCSNKSLEEINYNTFKSLMDGKETFILYISSTECHNCVEFTPKFENVLKENNLSAKKIEIDKLSDEDKDKFNETINVSGTPTVAFINDGEEESMTNRINGNVDEEKIISRLKSNGYIK